MGSVVFMEGFELYNGTGTGTGLQDKVAAGYLPQLDLIAGRYGGQALQVDSGGGIEAQTYALPVPLTADYTIGFAYRREKAADGYAISVRYSAGTGHMYISYTAGGGLTVNRSSDGAVLGTAAGTPLGVGSWSYIEMSVHPHATEGSVSLAVDGLEVLSVSGVDTAATGPITALLFSEVVDAGKVVWDDIYMRDDLVKLGPSRIESVIPASDVAGGTFLPSSGVDKFAMVDELYANGDTDYITGSAIGDTQTFGLPGITGNAQTVHAVQVVTNAKKVGDAGRAIKHVLSDGTNEIISASDKGLSTGYRFQDTIFGSAPDGSTWTAGKVATLKAGVRVSV